jgi:hypothetical protein
VTSEAQTRPRDEEEAVTSANSDGAAPGNLIEAADVGPTDARNGAGRRGAQTGGAGDGADAGARAHLSLPLVPTLSVLLVLLLAATAFLWLTRPGRSAVQTGNYVGALTAARSAVVDMTSFDYLTLDDDIEQIRRVATGGLRDQAVKELDGRRKEISDAQAVASTEIVGAGVTRATASDATALMVIQVTQKSAANPQAQVVRYRIRVELQKPQDRWLLSGIAGTEQAP